MRNQSATPPPAIFFGLRARTIKTSATMGDVFETPGPLAFLICPSLYTNQYAGKKSTLLLTKLTWCGPQVQINPYRYTLEAGVYLSPKRTTFFKVVVDFKRIYTWVFFNKLAPWCNSKFSGSVLASWGAAWVAEFRRPSDSGFNEAFSRKVNDTAWSLTPKSPEAMMGLEDFLLSFWGFG